MDGDDKKKFLDAFGLSDLIVMDQEHGDTVHVIDSEQRPERGDGLMLLERNVAGIIKTADCMPVIMVDPDYPVVAIVHAGWRGTVQKITHKALNKMLRLGARRENILVMLGPSIHACCYQIGSDVRRAFENEGFSTRIFLQRNHAAYLDLAQANRELLVKEGVKDILDIGLCTLCEAGSFASYRRGDLAERQISFVSLKG